jgi:cation diffusion facilitator CzcD-associated flavoprotein CzcO
MGTIAAEVHRMPQADVVIVGAGASGLSAAAALQRVGVDAVVLEQDCAVGGTWARRYDRLRLHTVSTHSGLAHYAVPRDRDKYLKRDDYVAYLQDYARHFNLRIVTDTSVEKIRSAYDSPTQWQVMTANAQWDACVVIVAVGQYRVPIIPPLPGRDLYRGEFIHSVDYRNAKSFVGKRVLVVGAGNSGAEIAADLVESGAASVAISIRTPPPIVPRDPFGRPVQRTGMLLSLLPPRIADRLAQLTARLVLGDLSRHGFPAADWRPYSSQRVPVIDVGFVRVLKQGRVQIRPALERLTETDAVFADGRSEPFDAIIAATGFRTGLDSLLEPAGALNADNEPATPSGEPTAHPGLYFIGYTHSLRGHLFEAHRASRRLAVNVARYLRDNNLERAARSSAIE